jgi:hypothetical protein
MSAATDRELIDLRERVDSHAERIAALYDMVAGTFDTDAAGMQEQVTGVPDVGGHGCENEGCGCQGVDETDMRVMQTLVERLTATVKTLEAELARKDDRIEVILFDAQAEGADLKAELQARADKLSRLDATVASLEAELIGQAALLEQAEAALMNVADQAHPWGQHLVGDDD